MPQKKAPLGAFFVFVMSLGLSSCANPSQRYDALAMELDLVRDVTAGRGFRHVTYANRAAGGTQRIHVYLEGDGTPWVRGRVPAQDPSPREPLAVRLMALDPSPALLLGRPCYHGLYAEPGCRPELWTDARYSETVVASMAAALERTTGSDRPVTLIGYSGGGTLAMLLAERVKNVDTVVTLAANLDVAAWASFHAYQPLTDSLDPAARPPLPPRVRQIHLTGAEDAEVPASLAESVARRQHRAQFRLIGGFDHRCCWLDAWPRLLQEMPDR